MEAPAAKIPQVSSALKWEDQWGSYKARWGVGRMHYMVDAGLYALGQPNHSSPVFVTANYKMSFDRLRQAVPDRNAWILVLDTKGINVWCAAGKGTFGTEELVSRIKTSGLERAAGLHFRIILVGFNAPLEFLTGFTVRLRGPQAIQF